MTRQRLPEASEVYVLRGLGRSDGALPWSDAGKPCCQRFDDPTRWKMLGHLSAHDALAVHVEHHQEHQPCQVGT